jgi:hypothetical protein
MMKHSLSIVFALALVSALGCKDKGPVPDAEGSPAGAPKVGSTETTGAQPGAPNPHAGLDIPPPGQGAASAPTPDESGMLNLGAIAFKVPGAWIVQAPKSSMRRAQLVAKGSGGPAELVVYYFGPQGAGSDQENIDRWIGQFKNPDGSKIEKAEVTSLKVAGHAITRVEAAGQYSNTMPTAGSDSSPVSDQRLLAAIVSTPNGPYYFKLVGPDATVSEQRETFDALLKSIVAAN